MLTPWRWQWTIEDSGSCWCLMWLIQTPRTTQQLLQSILRWNPTIPLGIAEDRVWKGSVLWRGSAPGGMCWIEHLVPQDRGHPTRASPWRCCLWGTGRDEKQVQIKFIPSRTHVTEWMMCLALWGPRASLHILWERGWPLGKVPWWGSRWSNRLSKPH